MPQGMNTDRPPLLQLEGVGRRFTSGLLGRRSVLAVDDVHLSLAPGESLAVVGESGSGKSTLGRLIAGLIHPSAGRILFQGRDIASLNGDGKAFRKAVQMIFQDADGSLNPRLTVRDLLLEPARVHQLPGNDSPEEPERLLRRAGLSPDILTRRPSEISGGQRQRIGIIRALSLAPKLIVADEPLASLDRSVQAHILCLMREAREQGEASFVYISHDLATVRLIADSAAVMYRGRIIEYGEIRSILGNPLHPYSRRLVASDPSRLILGTGRVDVQPQEHAAEAGRGCPYAGQCPESDKECAGTRPTLRAVHGRFVACHAVGACKPLVQADSRSNGSGDGAARSGEGDQHSESCPRVSSNIRPWKS